MLAELTADGVTIACNTSYAEKDLIRQVPGSRWDSTSRLWHVPRSWASCKVLRGLFRDQLEIGAELARWAVDEQRNRIAPAMALRDALTLEERVESIPPVLVDLITAWRDEGPLRLYPHQEADVAFMVMAQSALLGNPMGIGKTPSSCRTIRVLDQLGHQPFPVCVVAPNSVKRTWVREWGRWGVVGVPALSLEGSAQRRRKLLDEANSLALAGESFILIINWEAVRRHSRLAPYGSIKLNDAEKIPKELNEIPWRTVIVDEIHRGKEPHAKQSRAVWAVAHGPSVVRRYGLSGTLVANHVVDVWSPLHCISPVEFPAKTKYIDRWALTSFNIFGGLDVIGVRPDTREEFFAIIDPRLRRVPRELVLKNLPPKLRVTRDTEMSAKQAKAYKAMNEKMIVELDDGDVMLATTPLVKNTRLIQFSSSYAEIDEVTGRALLSEPSNKLDELMTVLEELDDAPLVVFAVSRQLLELARLRLEKAALEDAKAKRTGNRYSYRMIIGGMSEGERERSELDFQEGRARILLMNEAGSLGITLTRADTMLFLQRSWSLVSNLQSEDRVYRIGSEQHEHVTIIDLVTPDSVEEAQIARLHVKAARLEEINRDRETLLLRADAEAEAQLAHLADEETRLLGESLLP